MAPPESQGRSGPGYPDLKQNLFHSGMIRPVRGQGSGSRANGSFPKGAGRLSEKLPARHSPPHRRDGNAWERGRPARILSLWPPLSFSAMLQAAALPAGTA